MEENLKSLLISATIEQSNSSIDYSIFGLKCFLSILKESTDIFDEIPKNIYVSSDELSKTDNGIITTGLEKDLITNFGENVEKTIEFYEHKGILLLDDIYASAFGKLSYIYRAKGLRVYLLESSEIIVVTPYCYIDHNGFYLGQEEVDRFRINFQDLRETIDNLRSYLEVKANESFCRKLIEILISIKEIFQKAYYLEYLFSPPDVNKNSKFSEQIKYNLWRICLSDSIKEQLQENGMKILLQMGITPAMELIVNYLKRGKGSYQEILLKLGTLEKIMTKKDDIVEVKPNIWGIGINFNEVWNRIRNKWKRKK